jgi:hypothetical protein
VGQLRGINDAQGVGALVDGTHDLDVLEAIMLTVTKGRNIAKDIFERRVKGG